MIFLVTGAHGAVEVIPDCESSSEAMEVFREETNQPILCVQCISAFEADDDMADAFGGDG